MFIHICMCVNIMGGFEMLALIIFFSHFSLTFFNLLSLFPLLNILYTLLSARVCGMVNIEFN